MGHDHDRAADGVGIRLGQHVWGGRDCRSADAAILLATWRPRCPRGPVPPFRSPHLGRPVFTAEPWAMRPAFSLSVAVCRVPAGCAPPAVRALRTFKTSPVGYQDVSFSRVGYAHIAFAGRIWGHEYIPRGWFELSKEDVENSCQRYGVELG